MEDSIRLRLVPKNIALGLGGIVLGVGLMAVLTLSAWPLDAVSSLLGGIGMVMASGAAVLAGSAALFGSVREECAKCEGPLERYTTRFPESVYDDLVARVRRGSPMALAGLAGLPSPSPAAKALSALDYEVCPSCHRSGRVMAYRMRWDVVSKRFEAYDRVEPSDVGGWPMQRLVHAAQQRGARPSVEGESQDEL
jgi:hypothetical protein